MKTIWKFPIKVTDTQIVEMPTGAEILCVQTQFGNPQIWAMVNSEKLIENFTIEVFGTGNPVPIGARQYIGTFQSGDFVWHVFQRIE